MWRVAAGRSILGNRKLIFPLPAVDDAIVYGPVVRPSQNLQSYQLRTEEQKFQISRRHIKVPLLVSTRHPKWTGCFSFR